MSLGAQTEKVNVAPKNLDFVKKVKMSEEHIVFEFEQPYKDFTVEIAGPKDFYYKQDFKDAFEFKGLLPTQTRFQPYHCKKQTSQ